MTDLNSERDTEEVTIEQMDTVTGGDLLNHMINNALITVWIATGTSYRPTIATELP